ncbi:hypothetical protein GPECTOR_1g500 [Gonium pectorale]|uniref:Glycosyltransferase family 92 protein n=1 Tax=Gonium pectorale TaxID=33097 RepID=A0A150H405_GONPE|nr:hypothetical protein GPECTOR_1g500 [Gonium pectorale]|eukprot:KXZ56558.1 hypothetical protein GPECTOR_1g500 [Gonium pectorale]
MFGHVLMPVLPEVWHPQLLLETAEPGPGPLPAVLETTPELMRGKVADWSLRPYSMRFELPPGANGRTCFKARVVERLIEASLPGHKAPVCVPVELRGRAPDPGDDEAAGPGGASHVCESLAPSGRYNATAPALWTAIGPPRHSNSTREWERHLTDIAARVAHYLSYHSAMGLTGMLLYTNALMRRHLQWSPAIMPYLHNGQLRLVHWELHERGHELPPGMNSSQLVKPLNYNYDQALFASHALLGLSACGANLMLLVTDMDEFMYTPTPGVVWPAPLTSCMPRGREVGIGAVGMYRLLRTELLSSTVSPAEEPTLWVTPPRADGSAGGAAGMAAAAAAGATAGGAGRRLIQQQPPQQPREEVPGRGAGRRGDGVRDRLWRLFRDATGWAGAEARGGRMGHRPFRLGRSAGTPANGSAGSDAAAAPYPLASHPLRRYDRLSKVHMPEWATKVIFVPAAEVVAMFVHEAIPRHGASELVDAGCVSLLHLANYWKERSTGKAHDGVVYDYFAKDFQPFQNWVFNGTGTQSASATSSGGDSASAAAGSGGGGRGAGGGQERH